MAYNKEEQNRLKELLREAVTMLCKNRLTYEANFRIEGLLGITVDDKDVMLISLKEDVSRDDGSDACEVYQLTPMAAEEIETKDDYATTGSESEPLVLHSDMNTSGSESVVNLKPKTRERKRKPIKAFLENSNSKSEAVFDDVKDSNGDKKGFFSPTVDQIIQEYEQQQYTDSASLLYMAKRRRRKYPAHLSELHTQGLLPILPQAPPMVSILPKVSIGDISHKVITGPTDDTEAPTVYIKKEPGIEDFEDGSSNATDSVIGSVQHLPVESKHSPRERSTLKSRTRGDSPLSSGGILTSGLDSTTHWVEESILRQEGCFVSTRVMLRRHSSLRGETVVSIMTAMTRSRSDKNYIGEFKQQGRIQVFYKCPPMLLNPNALEPYKLTLDEYSNFFFANPKPQNGTPSQWLSYVNTVLEGVPYNPHLFPVESFDLEGEELEKMNTKRHILEQRFADITDGDGSYMLRSFKGENEHS